MRHNNYEYKTTSGYWQFAEVRYNDKGKELTLDWKTYANLDFMLKVLHDRGVETPSKDEVKQECIKEWRLSKAKQVKAGNAITKGEDDE
ncbi:MAG: hypothetical protein GY928_28150 [Colwellia sp.]|nr:hypothetical protein [Colwellia sp.]